MGEVVVSNRDSMPVTVPTGPEWGWVRFIDENHSWWRSFIILLPEGNIGVVDSRGNPCGGWKAVRLGDKLIDEEGWFMSEWSWFDGDGRSEKMIEAGFRKGRG